MNLQKHKRLLWVDYSKFIGIFLVVFGHTAIPKNLYQAIFSFHLPLFFFLSGYLFHFKKYDTYRSFLITRVRQIVLPYFFLNIITYVYWLLIGRKFGEDSTRVIKFYTPIIGIFYGNGTGDYLVHNIASWYLACLFTVENLFFVFFRRAVKNQKWIFLIAFLAAGYFDSTYDSIRWPWSFNVALVGLVFYAFGNLIRDKLDILFRKKVPLLVTALLIVFVSYKYFLSINGHVNLNDNVYVTYWYFWPCAFSGIFVTLILSRILEHYFGRIRVVEFISRNTMVILIFQFIALSLIKAFTLFILKIPLSIFDNKVMINVFISVIVVIILAPVIYIVENYFPFLVGRRLKH